MNRDLLIQELENRHIPFTNEAVDNLLLFMKHVLSWNEKFNLTAIKDEETFIEKMILDSALPLSQIDLTNKKVIDIGTGAGFPGMVLYLLNPNMNLTLLDSTSKKINLLNDYALENGYKYQGVTMRAEDFARKHYEQYDYAFARAVAPLYILLELIIPLLKENGVFVAMKGPGAEEEIKMSSKAMTKLGCHVDGVQIETLNECKESRTIIYIKKDKVTNRKYPRDYQTIKKQPL